MFYSSSIFGDSGGSLTPNQQTALVMFVNCISVVGASAMLNFAGRKALMLFWTLMCGLLLFLQGVATINSWGTIILLASMGFVASFEFAPGPILWLYLSEILDDKSTSVAVFINWTCCLIIGLVTPTMLNSLKGYTFIVFGVCNLLAVLTIFFFMKETRGLSDEQVKNLYRKDAQSTQQAETSFEKKMLGEGGYYDLSLIHI